MSHLLGPLSLFAACIILPPAVYLGVMALFGSGRRVFLRGRGRLRFAVVVPAHDEAHTIAATVRSVQALDYPQENVALYVVADNCSDDTAAVARACGATVLERHDPQHRGKGYALEHAFDYLLAASDADAVVVIDADTLASPGLLYAFEARLLLGAGALQADYRVRNVEASWRTRLMTVAMALFHRTRSLARERLGLSAGLRGNGMCFARQLLKDHPHRAYSVVEDVEYGIMLGLAGVRVGFVEEAYVYGEMVSRGDAAVTQRRRWEGGRLELLRRMGPLLLRRALVERNGMILDLALDLLVPPLSTLALCIVAGLGLEVGLWFWLGTVSIGLYFWSFNAALLLAYVARGVMHSGLGFRGVVALASAPLYVAWRLVALRRRPPDGWVRTKRES